jgi:Tfp pilus assembly PilM family ATPase
MKFPRFYTIEELREVDDQIARGDIELNDEVEMNSQTMSGQLTATRGEPTERRLRASRKAGVRSTLYYLASVLKCWLTR